jgi:hypothetical protein
MVEQGVAVELSALCTTASDHTVLLQCALALRQLTSHEGSRDQLLSVGPALVQLCHRTGGSVNGFDIDGQQVDNNQAYKDTRAESSISTATRIFMSSAEALVNLVSCGLTDLLIGASTFSCNRHCMWEQEACW